MIALIIVIIISVKVILAASTFIMQNFVCSSNGLEHYFRVLPLGCRSIGVFIWVELQGKAFVLSTDVVLGGVGLQAKNVVKIGGHAVWGHFQEFRSLKMC
jgi:hypothetical protein